MGEEYVDSLPPIEITQTEYEILNKHLVTNGFSDSAAQLAECYNQTDMNAVPPVRILVLNILCFFLLSSTAGQLII